MKRQYKTLLFLLVYVTISSCSLLGTEIEASGELLTIEGNFEDFDSVEISDEFTGVIELSDVFSSSVEIDKNIEDYLVFRKAGTTLKIGLENGINFDGDSPTFIIRMPRLVSYDGSDAAKVQTDDFTSTSVIKIDLSGASELDGDFESASLDLDVSGASILEISGVTQDVFADVSGASNARLNNLETVNADVDVSGASSIYLNVVGGELKGEASGASNVRYKGDPSSVSVSTTGSSTVTQD